MEKRAMVPSSQPKSMAIIASGVSWGVMGVYFWGLSYLKSGASLAIAIIYAVHIFCLVIKHKNLFLRSCVIEHFYLTF